MYRKYMRFKVIIYALKISDQYNIPIILNY